MTTAVKFDIFEEKGEILRQIMLSNLSNILVEEEWNMWGNTLMNHEEEEEEYIAIDIEPEEQEQEPEAPEWNMWQAALKLIDFEALFN
jgi:hypothetical protein